MTKHSPGPWVINPNRTWIKSQDWNVARVRTLRDTDPEVIELAEANGRLISAAPEMLEALKGIAWGLENPDDPVQAKILEMIAPVIAKAEGK